MDFENLEDDPEELLECIIDSLYLFSYDQLSELLYEVREARKRVLSGEIGLDYE